MGRCRWPGRGAKHRSGVNGRSLRPDLDEQDVSVNQPEHLNARNMPAHTQTTVIELTTLLAPEVKEIVLRSPETPLAFEPGQWISLHLPVGEKPPLVRAYSLARPADPSGTLTLCFDRVPDGLGSGYLFD